MSDTGVARLTAERIALELFGKGIVPSDAHAHAAKLIVEAHLTPLLTAMEELRLANEWKAKALPELKICEQFLDQHLGATNLGDYTHSMRRSVLSGIRGLLSMPNAAEGDHA